jgi:MFS family permease
VIVGWVAGRHGRRSIATTGFAFGLLGVLIVSLGWSTAHEDPFGAWAILGLLAILGINACTAIAGVALARHVASRDAHLD